MSIAVVIVNFHSEKYVQRCLSEFSRLGRTDLVCIIVDNSPPGCDDIIKSGFPSTTILRQAENLGFAAGANAGIRYALSKGVDFVCLLNPDTLWSDDFLAPLAQVLIDNPGVGLACPHIVTAQDNPKPWYSGGSISWLKGGPRHSTAPRNCENSWREVDYATGCCMLIRREVLEQTSLLPEFYFLYFEDADFSISTRSAGWTLAYCPTALLIHEISATTKFKSPAYVYYFARNRIWFMRRWATTVQFFLFCLTNTCIRLPIALVAFGLVDRQLSLVKAFLRGFVDGYRIKPETAVVRPYRCGSSSVTKSQ